VKLLSSHRLFLFIFVGFLLSIFAISGPAPSVLADGTRNWEQSKFEDLAKGSATGVAIRSSGGLELAPSFKLFYATPSTYIWAVTADESGNVYAATGSPARVYRITPDGTATIIFEPQELQVQTLEAGPHGVIYAATAPDGKVRIPLNEEASKSTGQIEEFLMKFNGEGIQHVALLSDDLVASIDSLRKAGVPLMKAPPATYYEMLDERLPGHGEQVGDLQARGILLDGTTEGGKQRLLLQIFSDTLLGPVFFEFIQRKGDDGFGEGNFKALFESLERDQLRRGVIQPA